MLVALIGTLAFYYSTLRPDWLRIGLALLVAVVTGFAIAVLPFRRGALLWGATIVALAIWYAQDRPSNDRVWEPEYAVPATASRTGRIVSVRRIRNFAYRSETDFTPAYYDAAFSLDDLSSLDLVSSYWSGDAIAHVFLTFGFRDGRHLAFSIETRRQKGFAYSTLAGFFHHYELFYVVADERDLIGVRTDIRRERVYLYRLHTPPRGREGLFLSYVDEVARLARRPEWYNTLTDNCTTGILARANAESGLVRYNWRVLISGYAAEYASMLGLLNTDTSFAELRRESLIRRPPGAVIDAQFSQEIRKGLPLAGAALNGRGLARSAE